jgi:hypothetical protein
MVTTAGPIYEKANRSRVIDSFVDVKSSSTEYSLNNISDKIEDKNIKFAAILDELETLILKMSTDNYLNDKYDNGEERELRPGGILHMIEGRIDTYSLLTERFYKAKEILKTLI